MKITERFSPPIPCRGGEIIGTIVPQNSRFGLTNGYKIIEIVYEDLQDVSVSERSE